MRRSKPHQYRDMFKVLRESGPLHKFRIAGIAGVHNDTTQEFVEFGVENGYLEEISIPGRMHKLYDITPSGIEYLDRLEIIDDI